MEKEEKIKNVVKKEENSKSVQTKHRRPVWLLLILPLALYFYFGLPHLGKVQTADEHLWISDRIVDYWNAVSKKEWRGTLINDKPGVTLALASKLGMLFNKQPDEKIIEATRYFNKYNPKERERVNWLYKLPLFILNGLLCFYFYWVLKKMTGNSWIALFSATFILLSPILLGISQIVNPDSLVWSFSAALLFTYLAYLKTEEKKLIIFAPIFFGLALASKYVSVIFFPFLFLATVASYFYKYPEWIEQKSKIHFKVIKTSLFYLFTVAGSLAVFSLLVPAVFVKPGLLYASTIQFKGMWPMFLNCLYGTGLLLADALLLRSFMLKLILRYSHWPKFVFEKIFYLSMLALFIFILVNWKFQLNIWGLNEITFESKARSPIIMALPFYKNLILEARPLIFSSTPLILFSLLAAWLIHLFGFKKKEQDFNIFILSSFMLVFFYAVIQQRLLINIRYGILIQPIPLVLAAIGIYEIFNLWILARINKLIVFVLILALSLPSLFLIRPFYFNYNNDILPKKYNAASVWGYGGYEAAQYLNSLPNAENLRIITNYFGICVFVKGECAMLNDMIAQKAKTEWKSGKINYFVVSPKGIERYRFAERFPDISTKQPVWEQYIDGRSENYLKIFKSN